jgi:hypothetical protein
MTARIGIAEPIEANIGQWKKMSLLRALQDIPSSILLRKQELMED